MTILALGGLLNDAACAILRDGHLLSAVEQKKVARRHQPGTLPAEAMQTALNLAGVAASSVDAVAVSLPLASNEPTALHIALREAFPAARLILVEHHMAHAASAFYASPFDRGNRPHPRPLRRFPLRRALAMRPQRHRRRARTLLPGLARRSLRPRHRTSGLRSQRRRAQGAMAFGPGRAVARRLPGDPRRRRLAAPRPRILRRRAPRPRRLQRPLLSGAWASADDAAISRNRCAPTSPPASSAPSSRPCSAWPAMRPQPLPRRRSRLQRAAGRGARTIGTGRTSSSNPPPATPAPPSAPCFPRLAHASPSHRRVPSATSASAHASTAEDIKQVLENCKLRFRYLLTTGET